MKTQSTDEYDPGENSRRGYEVYIAMMRKRLLDKRKEEEAE